MSRRTQAVARLLDQARAQRASGNLRAAEQACREALALQPHHPVALQLLAGIALAAGQPGAALSLSAQAVARDPSAAPAHAVRGRALVMLGRMEEAVAAFDRATALDPRNAEAQYSRGHALCDLGRPEEAIASYQAASRLMPGVPDVLNSLALALKDADRLDEAEAHLADALRLAPQDPVVMGNLASVLRDTRRHEEALALMQRAAALAPELEAEFHFNLAMTHLAAGRLQEGFAEMEWRWRMASMPPRPFTQPMWTGEALDGRTLLLHAEQGFGDTIQFCRYVPLVAGRAAAGRAAAGRGRVVLEVPPQLVRLLRGLPGVPEPGLLDPGLLDIVARGDALPGFDLHCPLMSLPHVFGTTLDTVPAAPSYLAADPAAAVAWRDRLPPGDAMTRDSALTRVGLVWASSTADLRLHRKRSIDPAAHMDALAGLLLVPGTAFVSLQVGGPPLPEGLRPLVRDWTDELRDFADTAALVAALDLVIGIDTAVVHLAGAQGKPVWLLNPYAPEWRWLAGQPGSPWYPSLRQFFQASPGDWPSVLAQAAAALRGIASNELPAPSPYVRGPG